MILLQGGDTTPIQKLWKESYVAIQEIVMPIAPSIADEYRDISNFIIILALALFLLIAHRRILDGIKCVLSAVVNQKLLFTIEEQSNLQICRDTVFVFLSICVSFVFANIAHATKIIGYENILPIKFVGICLSIMLYFLLRRGILRLLDWINGILIFKVVDKITYTYVSVWYILILCAFFVIKSIPSLPMGTMRYSLIISAIPVLMAFFFTLFKIFISKGFSHFFIFLYLCTLEILPIALLLYVSFT